MAKKTKKRTKRYHGEDAKRSGTSVSNETVVHRYEAVERSRVGEWWQGRKRTVKVTAIIAGILTGATWLLIELFQIIF